MNNFKNGKSCTLEKMNITLDMEKGHILKGIVSLQKASLLRVDRIPPNDKGKKYNMYYPIDTDKWDKDTDIELGSDVASGLNIALIA